MHSSFSTPRAEKRAKLRGNGFTEQTAHASVAVEVICELIKLDIVDKATLHVPTVYPLFKTKSKDVDLPTGITVIFFQLNVSSIDDVEQKGTAGDFAHIIEEGRCFEEVRFYCLLPISLVAMPVGRGAYAIHTSSTPVTFACSCTANTRRPPG